LRASRCIQLTFCTIHVRTAGVTPTANLTLAAMARAVSTEDLAIVLQHADVALVRAHGYEGNTALHVAAVSGNDGGCELLVAAGASVDARNARGETPLHMAASGGLTFTVNTLLRLGANTAITDAGGRRYEDVLPPAPSEAASSPDVGSVSSSSKEPNDVDGIRTASAADVDTSTAWPAPEPTLDAMGGGKARSRRECDVESVDMADMTQERFWEEFVHRRRPVRIRPQVL
jgi:hypothetical protein